MSVWDAAQESGYTWSMGKKGLACHPARYHIHTEQKGEQKLQLLSALVQHAAVISSHLVTKLMHCNNW